MQIIWWAHLFFFHIDLEFAARMIWDKSLTENLQCTQAQSWYVWLIKSRYNSSLNVFSHVENENTAGLQIFLHGKSPWIVMNRPRRCPQAFESVTSWSCSYLPGHPLLGAMHYITVVHASLGIIVHELLTINIDDGENPMVAMNESGEHEQPHGVVIRDLSSPLLHTIIPTVLLSTPYWKEMGTEDKWSDSSSVK